MRSPRSAPWRKLLVSGPGLAGETEGSASADRDRTGDIGSGRYQSAAASIPQRPVSRGEMDRSAGPAGSDTGAGHVPYTGWPASPHAADVESRETRSGAENAGETHGLLASGCARDCLGADCDT